MIRVPRILTYVGNGDISLIGESLILRVIRLFGSGDISLTAASVVDLMFGATWFFKIKQP